MRALMVALLCAGMLTVGARAEPPSLAPVRESALAQPVPGDSGGLFAHDLDGDGRLDLVVTSDGHIGAYDSAGGRMWVHECPIALWAYAHHPSAIAGDLDGDGQEELAYGTGPREVVILDARTGVEELRLALPQDCVAMAIANLRGLGDRDILLQYDQTHIGALAGDTGELLWETDAYRGIEHSPLRQADLDGDGLDEVAGASIIDHDGTLLNSWDLGHVYASMDSLVIADVVPGLPLEVVLAEQNGSRSHTDVVNADRIVFQVLNPWDWEDPDKVAVGEFDPERPGLEVFNRSSGGDGVAPRGDEEPFVNEEGPWVLSAEGELLAKYYVNDRKPEWWTGHGLEEVCRIDWDGDGVDELAAKERHILGAGAVVAPLTGEFLVTFPGRAARLYAIDLEGDAREEVVTLDESGAIRIFADGEPNRHPERASPWSVQHYRRQKQNWDYYSS